MSIYLICGCCEMSKHRGNCHWRNAYLYVYIRTKEKGKYNKSQEEPLFLNAGGRSRGKPACDSSAFLWALITAFQSAEGLNLPDICMGCTSFVVLPTLFKLLAKKTCPSRMYWEYLWLTQEYKSLQWEAGGSSATWLWVEMVKIWQLCYSLSFFTGGFSLPAQNISSNCAVCRQFILAAVWLHLSLW